MKIIAIIPARYDSMRFPGKPIASILGKPMIQWVYERIKMVSEITKVYVATDDDRIMSAVKGFNGEAVLTSNVHTCGSDRLAECAEILGLSNEDIILNIQGDEPLVHPNMVRDLISIFEDSTVYMGTLKKQIDNDLDLNNPNVVKVVTDNDGNALYFSRYCIPYKRNLVETPRYKHIGVYGYTKDFLLRYSKMDRTPLEKAESLEQLRVLENGYTIRVRETRYSTIGVDTPEQLKEAEEAMKKENKNA